MGAGLLTPQNILGLKGKETGISACTYSSVYVCVADFLSWQFLKCATVK